MRQLFTVLVLLLLPLACSTDGHHCKTPAFEGNISPYPKHPWTFDELDQFMKGRRSEPLYEVYGLSELEFPPALRKLVLRWLKDENGVYGNVIAGWYPEFQFCFETNMTFERADKGSNVAILAFNIHLPDPVPHIGTMYSSCPERYIISWHCLADKLHGNFCSGGTRMSILTYSENIHNLPWHMIAADLCSNNSPNLDDPRWRFVYEGDVQCEGDVLPPSNGANRQKREALKYVTREEFGRDLYP